MKWLILPLSMVVSGVGANQDYVVFHQEKEKCVIEWGKMQGNEWKTEAFSSLPQNCPEGDVYYFQDILQIYNSSSHKIWEIRKNSYLELNAPQKNSYLAFDKKGDMVLIEPLEVEIEYKEKEAKAKATFEGKSYETKYECDVSLDRYWRVKNKKLVVDAIDMDDICGEGPSLTSPYAQKHHLKDSASYGSFSF